ncbi:hypothetical protein Tco_0872503 [Tanacetum coccineum]
MSSAEDEYVSLSACCAQVIWMRTQLLDYGYRYHNISIYCDSKSAIAISCNPVQHSRTKHINIRYHFIKEHVEKGIIELYFIGTEYELADLFTKAFPKERFEFLVHKIVFHTAQHVIPGAQLVPQYKSIGRCNNYAVLQSIPCSPECKIRTVSKVPDTEDTIKFLLDTQQFIYAMDMFRDTLHLPVETPDTPFVTPANIHKNQCRELKHQIEEAVKSGQLVHLVKGVKKKEKASQMQRRNDVDSEIVLEHGSHKGKSEVVDDDILTMNNVLTDFSIPITTTSKHSQDKKRISNKYSHLPGALRRMCKRQGYMIQDMQRKCVTTKKFWETHNKVDHVLKEVILNIAKKVVNDLIEYNLKPCIAETIIEDHDAFREYDFHSHHDEHQDDDAPPEGEKRVKRSKKLKRSKSAREENVVDEDEVISEDVTPELIAEFQNIDKRVPTIFDHARMEATLRDSLSNLSRNAKEYAYHLEQSTSFMENQIYGNTKEKKYILSLHKFHAEEFPEPDLEEKLNRWVRKEFKTFNEDAWLSIQHWKDSWHKRVYKQNQKKVKNNPEDYYSNHRITEVVRIVTDQPHGDFKYLKKNDIKDLYYLCRSKEIDNRKIKLMNSLITFIRSCVISERNIQHTLDSQYCMEDPEQAFVEYASSRTDEAGVLKAITDRIAGALPSDTVKNPKLSTSPNLRELRRREGQPGKKRVHFVNSIVILNKEGEAKEESSMEACKAEFTDHKMSEETEEVESEEEVDEETEDEDEEKEKERNPKHFNIFPTMNELKYHEWLLKNPRPPWVKAKIRTGNVNNVKLHYNWIISNRLKPIKKPSNPKKNYNFVGRVRGLKVFVGNFTYECDFMLLEDTTSVIDHYLRSVVFGKPFIEEIGLVYNKEEETVVFERDTERSIFKMPHKMDMFKHIDFIERGTDYIPPFIIESDVDNCEKTHYSSSLDLGPEYKYDEYGCKGIRSLMSAKARRKNKGEVTRFLIKNEEEIFTDTGDGIRIIPDGVAPPAMLYLTRRSLEVLRKFHLTTLGGRFNQLSHVSSLLLSKPWEY